ncbi:hypothetical protein KSP39_PZI013764 [Platanthera zijinensis]|uniref:Uncharacterized protein n=1 Tax=Platanthera zijinensis TaxID=2320716 RepID=A0AAP0G444_9ASPA
MGGEDGILALFELHWFHRFVLHRSSPTTLPPPDDDSPDISVDSDLAVSVASESSPTLFLRYHSRSTIDELESSTDIEIQKPALQKIPSGKIPAVDVEPIAPPIAIRGRKERRLMRSRDPQRAKRRERRERSKSLSELEFEEVKGFIDLGFTFSDAEASDPWLISILPGLQRLKAADEGDSLPAVFPAMEVPVVVTRPYLSEAWDAAEEEEMSWVLRNWRIPAQSEGVVMKDHLRFWAHAVASAVL